MQEFPFEFEIWSYISSNPNITMDFIKEYIDKSWNWQPGRY